MGLMTRTVAELPLVNKPPLTKAVKVTTLPLKTVGLVARTALIVTRLSPGIIVWVRVPDVRLLVNI